MRRQPAPALLLAAALSACAAGMEPSMSASMGLERKPHFGEAASATFAPQRFVFTVLLNESSTADAVYLLGRAQATPGGAFNQINGLEGDGWTMQEVVSLTKADGRFAGLCGANEPSMVFARTLADGSREVKGFSVDKVTDKTACPVLRFLN